MKKYMKETEWAKLVAERLDTELSGFHVQAGKKLTYANEIIEYDEGSSLYNEMGYETDILIYESTGEKKWKPRVVIETKINSVTTHDAITYSQKASAHKYVHPYLRYGIFIGNRKHYPLPGRLFRHGAHFDFMLSWKGYEPLEYEWIALIEIANEEISASKQLEEMFFNSRNKDRIKYFALHKPLITKSIKNTNE
ncbi:conserved hypothetical protein (plasmid) [Desulforapulum autotrophicum HRM2]|uniref:Restriction endonuclease n=2 Tax=Desulforapulum autotrophicum TaxID=2296 RepID=C0QMQ6_DESAH|nr:conserved hypothetical protein [Desulforapulum autotrophicum HRM2]